MKFEPIVPNESETGGEGELPSGVRELRRFVRHNISAKGWIRHQRRRVPVKLENLSEQGCQFWLPVRAGVELGAPITLYIDSIGPFEATVRWWRDGWTGVEFDLPVYPPVLAHMQRVMQPEPESDEPRAL